MDRIEIRDLLGAPFVNSGRDPRTGLDCWGLFMEAMRRFGKEVPDFRVSCFLSDRINRTAEAELARAWTRIAAPRPGCGLTIRFDPDRPGLVQHFGVCVDRSRFIHTTRPTGVILTRLSDPYWGPKIEGYWEWTG